MNVALNGPQRASYSDNFLIKPLIKFNGKVVSTIEKLPEEAIVCEIAKRIMILVAAPLAYLIFSFMALSGLIFNSCIQKRNITKPLSLISIATECDNVKKLMMITIDGARKINQIVSAKIFMDVEFGDKKFSKDYIFKQEDASNFNQEFLSTQADAIFNEAKEFLQIKEADKVSFKWHALLKDEKGKFHGAHATTNKKGYLNQESSGSEHGCVNDKKEVDSYFNLVLDEMGREIKPQLNDQLEFV